PAPRAAAGVEDPLGQPVAAGEEAAGGGEAADPVAEPGLVALPAGGDAGAAVYRDARGRGEAAERPGEAPEASLDPGLAVVAAEGEAAQAALPQVLRGEPPDRPVVVPHHGEAQVQVVPEELDDREAGAGQASGESRVLQVGENAVAPPAAEPARIVAAVRVELDVRGPASAAFDEVADPQQQAAAVAARRVHGHGHPAVHGRSIRYLRQKETPSHGAGAPGAGRIAPG